ncbi:MAG: prolyl oligopeptidase family serine peptidase, partial [Nitrospira sp.]|nr:prolyl oligopeptidase family serine peptidase [Nitrospira sp.]
MISFLSTDLAREVADRVYTGTISVPFEWQVDTSFGNGGQVEGDNGGYVYALKPFDPDDTRRILAFRGTEISLTNVKDLYADLADIGKEQFDDLRNAVNTWLAQELVNGNRVEFVGHSLGGALVQWAMNDTNMLSVLELARQLPDPNGPESVPNSSFQIDFTRLHFTTFNAPGISFVQGEVATDHTSVVVGEHHVVIGHPPFVQGDIVHLLGGPPVGADGSQVLAHQVEFWEWGNLLQRSGIFAHTITIPEYFDSNLSPVVPYTPPYLDASVAQSFATNVSKLGNTDGTVDGNLEAMARLGLFALASGVGLAANTVALAAELSGLPFNRNLFADMIAAPVDGINRGLIFLTETAMAAGNNAADFSVRLSSGFVEFLSGVGSIAASVPNFISETLAPVLLDIAHGIANAVEGFLEDVQGTLFDLGQTLDFADLNPFTTAYSYALRDATLSAELRTAVEEAQQIVEHAGQTVAIRKGIGFNPFDTSSFDPSTAPPATVTLKEGQGQTLSIYLPFDAGTGGQHLRLSLNGPNASTFVLRTTNGEVPQQNGGFSLIVPEGANHLAVELQGTEDVSSSGTLSFLAVLTDVNNQQTHESGLEATITLSDTGKLLDGSLPIIDYFNGQQSVTWVGDNDNNEPSFNAGANHVAFGNGGFDILDFSQSVALFNHQIYGGIGNDALLGGEGKDRLFGEEGFDFLSGGGGQDVLYGGDTGDRLLGDSSDPSLVNSVPGNDYLDGGLGDDRLEGQAGDDTLHGGVGNDMLFGDDHVIYVNRPVGRDYLD